MLTNYLKIAFRNLWRNKLITLILIFGLASSLAAFLFINQYVIGEFSYDSFHTRANDIYRIRLDDYAGEVQTNSTAISYYAEAPAIKAAYPDVENFVRLHRANGMVSYQQPTGDRVSYHEERAFYADSSFFTIFSFPLLSGLPTRVLRQPEAVAVSATMAQKYFGKENPIGKTITLSTEWQGGNYVVSGVFADFPANSHFHADFIFSIQNLLKNDQFRYGGWYWTNFYTYLLLKPGTAPDALQSRLSAVIEQHLGRQLKKLNIREAFVLQPLRDIHLRSRVASEIEPNGRVELVYVLMLVSLAILTIGWLNYVNLSTARGMKRAKEVGIRKALGSERRQLVGQFLFESFILNLLASVLAVGFFWGLATVLGHWFVADLSPARQLLFRALGVGVFGVGFILSGLYPALVLSSFRPIAVLKGRVAGKMGGALFRQTLVVFQFTASTVLIVATLVVGQQINFMQTQELGMNIDRKLVVRTPKVLRTESFTNDMAFVKDRLLSQSGIERVTVSSEVPGQEIFWVNDYRRYPDESNPYQRCSFLAVDEDFLGTYDIELLAGRNFYEELANDNDAIIINQTALRAFGFDSPAAAIDQQIGDDKFPKRIVGVIRDFHQQSLAVAHRPLILNHLPWASNYLTISVGAGNLRTSVAGIRQIYRDAFPGNAFDFFFLDDHFQRQYRADERLASLFSWFAVLAISIACLGLFGLAMFTAEQRTKEIGVRKVLGASVGSIVALLSKDFLKLVLIAIVIASPLAWYIMNRWLQDFAYKITIDWWVFALAGLLAVGIALLTVSFQSIRAALMNPVKSLRSE